MVTTRRNGQPKGGLEPEQEIPNLKAMVAAAIANLLPGLNADEVINRMIRDYRNGAGSSRGSGGGGQPTTINGWLERFNKLKPLPFKSVASPQEAEDWITHMEKNFEVLGCGDEFKARLAAFKLESDALQWWKTHKRAKGGDTYMASCTWTEFRDTFYKRRQEQKGHDYRASNRSGNDRQGYQGNNNRQWKDQPSKGTQQNRSSGLATQQRPTEVLPPPPLCPTCGKPHPGPCRKLTGECYRCGSNTHRVKDCPKGNPSAHASTPRLPAPSGRVFTTTRDKAAGTSDLTRVEEFKATSIIKIKHPSKLLKHDPSKGNGIASPHSPSQIHFVNTITAMPTPKTKIDPSNANEGNTNEGIIEPEPALLQNPLGLHDIGNLEIERI
ncbi:reverse transcriptase domain-containing protein [Artemisia annua]|uniref:Reverse transcriptase domain-containing protein n=1 Tax=Artemisia annua TaxID=35608 RepID=A0A2U1M7G4_ARTAN|nr:reverse transcriptase domain-containing protein [Artemisia annua]